MATLEKVKKNEFETGNAPVNLKQATELFNNPEKKIIEVTGNELFEIQQAVQKTLSTSISMKGEYVRFFLDNLTLFDPVVMPMVDKHSKVITKYVSKREDGSPNRNKDGFVFDDEKSKQNYEAESDEIWNKTITVYVRTIESEDFDKIEFNMKENNTVYLILKWLTKTK